MIADSGTGPVDRPALPELAGMLRDVTGQSQAWAARITPETRLEDDLDLDSVELTALAELVRRRCGPAVDLSGYLSGLDFDELIALTVGDLLTVLGGAGGEPR
jgi:acyl carrier protein